MASTSLRPNGTNASSSITFTNSGTQAEWEQVDDDPDAVVTSDYVANSAGTSASIRFALTDCPSDLSSMDSVSINTYWTCVNYVDDGMDCHVQVLAADGTTALTTKVRIAGVFKGSGKTPTQGLQATAAETPTDTTKTTWDGALLLVEWTYIGNMGNDGIQFQLGAIEVNGTYTASAAGPAQTVSPTGVADSDAIGSPTVTSTVTVSPTGLDATGSVGSPTVSPGPVTVSPTGIASASAVGSPTVSVAGGAQTVSPTGVASASAVGSPTVSPGPVTVSPTGVASSGSVGSPTVTPGAVTVSPTGVASAEAIGTPTVSAGTTVSPTGVSDAGAVGSPTVTPGPVTISPAGVDASGPVGSPAVTTAITVQPGGVSASTLIGSPVLSSLVTVSPTGVGTSSTVGSPVVSLSAQVVSPKGVRDQEIRPLDLVLVKGRIRLHLAGGIYV